MELSLIGLQNAGKTSLVNVVATGGFHEDMIPTVGFNMRKVTKGAVTIKLWDLGGQVPLFNPVCFLAENITCIRERRAHSDAHSRHFEECYLLARHGRACGDSGCLRTLQTDNG